MAITWSSVGHFFASGFHDIVVGAKAVAAHNAQIQATGTEVEAITSTVGAFYPPALAAVEIERIAMACLGEFAALVLAYGTAAKAATAKPEVDPSLLSQVEQAMQQNPQLAQQAAALFNIKTS